MEDKLVTEACSKQILGEVNVSLYILGIGNIKDPVLTIFILGATEHA